MRDNDPLEDWLIRHEFEKSVRVKAQAHAQARVCLERLNALLAGGRSKKTNLFESGIGRWGAPALDPADLSRAEELYHVVVVRGGSGSTFVQEGLLEMIASARDPASVPFWLGLLDLRRPRDSFAARRRAYALAAFALLAVTRNAPEGWKALGTAARYVDPEVRALAVHYIGRACLRSNSPAPSDVRAQLADIAQHDSSFGARFQARLALLAAGEPAPLDYPGGVFLFKISGGRGGGFSRTIALRSEQTLDDLHLAIQNAIDWDADHLYSFFMNGKSGDQHYAFSCPFDKESPPFADEAVIGALGLMPKHKFLYLFDYGDCHEFAVEVVGILARREKGVRYPRVLESHGEAPQQYPDWDERFS
jgi:hypothetical protein